MRPPAGFRARFRIARTGLGWMGQQGPDCWPSALSLARFAPALARRPAHRPPAGQSWGPPRWPVLSRSPGWGIISSAAFVGAPRPQAGVAETRLGPLGTTLLRFRGARQWPLYAPQRPSQVAPGATVGFASGAEEVAKTLAALWREGRRLLLPSLFLLGRGRQSLLVSARQLLLALQLDHRVLLRDLRASVGSLVGIGGIQTAVSP